MSTIPKNLCGKVQVSFVLPDILCSKGDCILVIYEMVSAYTAAKQIGCNSTVLDYKAINIKKTYERS